MKLSAPLLVLAAVLLSGGAAGAAGAACVGEPARGAVRLNVVASGVRSARGEVVFTVYPDDRRRFLAKGGKLLRARVPAEHPVTGACFLLPPGAYAIAQYHDENDDHDFNHTLFLPKEGYGFSRDAPATFGLPSFASARFVLGPGAGTQRMTMRYP